MEHKNIRLIIVVTVFTILTTGCSILITRNYYSAKTSIKTDSTTYVLKLDSETYKPNDGQR